VHNSYFFLAQLSAVLHQRLQGFVLVSCFSQNKDELVMEFNNARQSFFIRASLQPALCGLSFPNVYHRAKKNSIDLFLDVLMKQVVSVTQFENERSFSINLESGWALLFKMHGSQSNVILLREEEVLSIFKNQFEADWNINTRQLNRTIDWSKEGFFQSQQDLKAKYFTLGREVWEYLGTLGFEGKSVDIKWDMFESTLAQLRAPTYFIGHAHHKAIFSLLPISNAITQFTDPIEAVNSFFQLATTESALEVEKKNALKYLQEQIKNKKSFTERNERKLSELLNNQHYQLWGDLIMANMHLVKPGMESVTLTNFYNQQPVNIKLKIELNAQRNAEVFYRKSKNQQIEIAKLRESIIAKQKEIAVLQTRIAEVEQTEDIKQLRKENERAKPKNVTPLPYREVEFKGFKIWVGKSAEANDELTLKHSYKEDLWLHAKDVAGSHVLVKHQANKPFPKDVIERAAALAAYYSKRKNETLCPVTVTAKKFVRKRKGDPVGAVVVEKEDVLLVEPKG
jgi:predicted ribosome quality control (RQC) complex YloA/Tae2 family protein